MNQQKTETLCDAFRLTKKSAKYVRQVWISTDAGPREEKTIANGVGATYLKRRGRVRSCKP